MLVLNCIKSNFGDAIISSCSELGCKLRLNGLNSYVVLKGESVCKNRRICDCIVFARENPIIIGIVELKGKTTHSNKIIKKLSNGTEIALDILKKCKNNMGVEFYHLISIARGVK